MSLQARLAGITPERDRLLASVWLHSFARNVASLKKLFTEINYELVHKLAEGGMGLVYEAIQLGAGNFKKVVAVKLIREEYSAIPEFQKEVKG